MASKQPQLVCALRNLLSDQIKQVHQPELMKMAFAIRWEEQSFSPLMEAQFLEGLRHRPTIAALIHGSALQQPKVIQDVLWLEPKLLSGLPQFTYLQVMTE